MKAVILGYGSIGKRHAKNLEALGVEVVGAYDPLTSPIYDWKQAAAGNIVVIASPTKFHAEQLIEAVYVGASGIFLEKPPAISLHQFSNTVLKLGDNLPPVAVGFNWRFHPGAQAIRDAIEDLGSLSFSLTAVDDVLMWENMRPGHYAMDPEGGGCLLTSAVHSIDLAIHLMGKPTAAGGVVAVNPVIGPVDSSNVILIQHGDRMSAINVLWSGPPSISSGLMAVIKGPEDDPVKRSLDTKYFVITDFLAKEWEEATHHKMHYDCMEAFVKWVDGGESGRLCTLSQALDVMWVVDAVRLSSENVRMIVRG